MGPEGPGLGPDPAWKRSGGSGPDVTGASEGPARALPEAPEAEGVLKGRRDAEVAAPEVEGQPSEAVGHPRRVRPDQGEECSGDVAAPAPLHSRPARGPRTA